MLLEMPDTVRLPVSTYEGVIPDAMSLTHDRSVEGSACSIDLYVGVHEQMRKGVSGGVGAARHIALR